LIYFRISKVNKEEVLSKAENDLAAVVNQYIGKLVKELQGTDFWKLRRAYTFGVSTNFTVLHFFISCNRSEYAYCDFCRYKNILKLQRCVDFARLALY
jgi:hypothetical protein